MKEGRIILPVNGNDGEPLTHQHFCLRIALIKAFNGFTETAGRGGWTNSKGAQVLEDVMVYDVAGYPSDNVVLISIAKEVGAMAGQECVYVRDFDGRVELISPAPFRAVA